MSRHVPRHTFRWSPPPPLRVMVARPAQVTQVTQVPITLTQHDTAAAPCDTTHPMWRHRGTARPEPPPPPPPWLGKLRRILHSVLAPMRCPPSKISAPNRLG